MLKIHSDFAGKAVSILQGDNRIEGLAAGGSWISGDMDAYSDLDLVVVTFEPMTDADERMSCAGRLGHLLSAFTGEHVGEPRLLICLYDEPLLHVDLKFIVLDELYKRVEDPVILLDKHGRLQAALKQSQAVYPYPDLQWIEDRFWIWVHYGLQKTGRGEYFEALDFLSYLRMVVLGPLLQMANNALPRGVRKVESALPEAALAMLKGTLAMDNKASLLAAIGNTIALYRSLREQWHSPAIIWRQEAEKKVVQYYYSMTGGKET